MAGHLQPDLPVRPSLWETLMTISSARASFRVLMSVSLLALAGGHLGCAQGEFRLGDPFDRQLSLSESQHRYTVFMRWSQFQKAKAFVAKDEQEDFLLQTKALKDARFTDYESDPVELDEEKEMATIRVTYTVYTPSLPYEVEVNEIQEWTRNGVGNNWSVHSNFEGLNKLAAN
jgi:hypothetical protein